MIDNWEPGKHERLEKAKARELRNSRWWKQKIAQCKCHYCGKDLDAKTATMDHIIPISLGGKSTKGNVVPACKDCNTKKKNDLPDPLKDSQA